MDGTVSKTPDHLYPTSLAGCFSLLQSLLNKHVPAQSQLLTLENGRSSVHYANQFGLSLTFIRLREIVVQTQMPSVWRGLLRGS